MLRKIVGVVVGYLVYFVAVFCTFTALYLAVGANGAFRPGSYETSMLWNCAVLVLTLIAAIVGGYVCVWIARSAGAVKGLAVFMVVIGLLFEIPAFMASSEPAKERTAEVGNLEAMGSAKMPIWIMLLNPVIGVAGVMIGGRLKKP